MLKSHYSWYKLLNLLISLLFEAFIKKYLITIIIKMKILSYYNLLVLEYN